MSKRMLIDANHPEETRVVVLDGSKVEEFDFEAASKRPLKGNIYLAKVTRVEPSLQAAFVEYGGNRQGFLAFAEIHPDYYQIPAEDRQALIAEQEAEARRRSEDDIESFEISSGPKPDLDEEGERQDEDVAADEEPDGPVILLDAATVGAPEKPALDDTVPSGETEPHETELGAPEPAHDDVAAQAEETAGEESHDEIFVNHGAAPVETDGDDDEISSDEMSKSESAERAQADYGDDADAATAEAAMENEGEIEPVDGAVADAEAGEAPDGDMAAANGEAKALQMQRPAQKWVRKKHYKIQEVIKRRQIILVQVVKEERGNKGAALTTYLSLAGRYCVLMPNTPRGGGISRKITNAADRKRLKSAAQGLELPEGMGLIIRTAGENRSKIEIRRDYEYLMRLWDTIREKTLSSHAPACVHEEGDLIKRAIRDLYNNDVSDIVVEGEQGHRNARDFMRMLMPSHAKNVHQYKDSVPLFQRMHIEAQLDAMFSSTVTLKSGGYIVINQTEALVSIDVNSGRATREHSIEETARKTNLEAADEVGRQLRLRDLAGLIVIDFIDMEEGRNDREVEKRLREAVKNDRARVQIGKISQFGLMEMSRQRLRAGVIAGSTITCPHCDGAGIVRSVESTALRVLRAIEEEGEKNRAAAVTVKVAGDIAIYVLNQKRRELARIEAEYGMDISFEPKDGLTAGNFELERTRSRDPGERPRSNAVSIEAGFVASDEADDAYVEEVDEAEDDEIIEADDESESEAAEIEGGAREAGTREVGLGTTAPRGEKDEQGKRRRRRGGRGRNRDRRPEGALAAPRPDGALPAPQLAADGPAADGNFDAERVAAPREFVAVEDNDVASLDGAMPSGAPQDGRRKRRRRGRRGGRDRNPQTDQRMGEDNTAVPIARDIPAPLTALDRFGNIPDEIDTTPNDLPRAPNAPSAPVWSLKDDIPDTTPTDDNDKPVKKGWWQRTFSGE